MRGVHRELIDCHTKNRRKPFDIRFIAAIVRYRVSRAMTGDPSKEACPHAAENPENSDPHCLLHAVGPPGVVPARRGT
jgi:hypothetical protein